MSWKQTIIKGKIVNAIIRVERGSLDIEQFIQDAYGMWLAGLDEGLFNDHKDFERLLIEHNFPKNRLKEVDEALLYGDYLFNSTVTETLMESKLRA